MATVDRHVSFISKLSYFVIKTIGKRKGLVTTNVGGVLQDPRDLITMYIDTVCICTPLLWWYTASSIPVQFEY